MAIVALEGHEVRILHVDSRRRCVGVTGYFKRYFNTDFKFERMKVTVSIIETFVIQLWSLLLMLTIFERSLIKKLNLIPLNLLGASFDACALLSGVRRLQKILDVLPTLLPLQCSFAGDEQSTHWQRNSKEQRKKQNNQENNQDKWPCW